MSLQPSLGHDHVYTCRLPSTLIAHRRKYTHMARLGCRGRPMDLTNSQERHLGPVRDQLRPLAASPRHATAPCNRDRPSISQCPYDVCMPWHSKSSAIVQQWREHGACGCGGIRPWHRDIAFGLGDLGLLSVVQRPSHMDDPYRRADHPQQGEMLICDFR